MAAVAGIDVKNKNARCSAGCHPYICVRPPLPPPGDPFHVRSRVLETVRSSRMFSRMLARRGTTRAKAVYHAVNREHREAFLGVPFSGPGDVGFLHGVPDEIRATAPYRATPARVFGIRTSTSPLR